MATNLFVHNNHTSNLNWLLNKKGKFESSIYLEL